MKKSKRIVSLVSAGLLATSTFAAAGCKKVANDPQTLEIYIGRFGYGIEWLNEIIDDFKNEDWVKTKYPELNIPEVQYNSVKDYSMTQITSGETTTDLFFTTLSAASYYSQMGEDGKSYFEELSDLYETEIVGEGRTVGDKMDDTFYKNYKLRVGQQYGYYALPWAQGPWGVFYNTEVVENKLGANYKLPTTTNGLEQMCEDLKSANQVPFIFSSAEDYQSHIVDLWWAQYEGYDGYERFWLGVDESDQTSVEIFSQKGRLRALETMEALVSLNSGNIYEHVNTINFQKAQSQFLAGDGALQMNGDWVQCELGTSGDEANKISMMKTPVLSSIVEKLSFYKTDKEYNDLTEDEKAAYDEKLQAIIAEVDSGATESVVDGVSANDFKRVKEARSMVELVSGHDALIPSYSTAKDLAKDFLMYMVSDKGLSTYIESTNGCKMAYEYDVETKNPTLYSKIPEVQKDKLAMLNNGVVNPMTNTYELNYLGMVSRWTTYSNITMCFTTKNAGDYHSANDIYQADITYYTKDNQKNWNSVLQILGW